MIYLYIYFLLISFFFAVINQLGVYQLLYCLVYSYWSIHFKLLLLSNFRLYRFFNYIYIFVTTFRFFNKSLRENGRARGRDACLLLARPFFLVPTTFKRLLRRLSKKNDLTVRNIGNTHVALFFAGRREPWERG